MLTETNEKWFMYEGSINFQGRYYNLKQSKNYGLMPNSFLKPSTNFPMLKRISYQVIDKNYWLTNA